jgi:multidrug efflux pump subunit AcrA (membrane-fusion protein)
MMDIARRRPIAVRLLPRMVVGTGALGIAVAGAWGVVSLRAGTTAVFTMDRASIVTDVVHRGTFVRSVAASGTIAARRVAIVAAPADGTVDAVFVHPGSEVTAGQTIATLANPAVDGDIADARAQIVAAQADLASVRQEATTTHLERVQAVRATEAERSEDSNDAATQTSLHAQGYVGDNAYHQALTKLAEATDREALQRAEVVSTGADGNAKIASAQAKIAQLRGQLARKIAARDALVVRAGTSGVVQSVTAQLGAHLTLGSEAARVADRDDLEAMLAVVEGDARSVVPGLGVAIATAAGAARGTVVRVDPAATGGTVQAEVALTKIPPGVRIDEHVDAQIELQRVANAVSIARPAGAADDTTFPLYRLVGNDRAERVAVELGKGSSDAVIVKRGLVPGETVIVSDMSAAADHPLVTLK